jgi:hypothetical protein
MASASRDDGAERCGSPLPERPLERALLAGRLEAAAARRARCGERAGVAARYPSETDRLAEIHQRLAGGGGEVVTRPFGDTPHVDVDR